MGQSYLGFVIEKPYILELQSGVLEQQTTKGIPFEIHRHFFPGNFSWSRATHPSWIQATKSQQRWKRHIITCGVPVHVPICVVDRAFWRLAHLELLEKNGCLNGTSVLGQP